LQGLKGASRVGIGQQRVAPLEIGQADRIGVFLQDRPDDGLGQRVKYIRQEAVPGIQAFVPNLRREFFPQIK
jgi:hypothetical protein